MDTLTERAVRALLLAAAVTCVLALPAGTQAPVALYAQYLLALLAAGLVLAAFTPSLQAPVVGAAVLAKSGGIGIALVAPGAPQVMYLEALALVLLVLAAALLLWHARREARWEGRAPTRRDGYARTAG